MVTSTAGAARRGRIRIAAGPLATEALLLEELDERLAALGLEALRAPVRVVVPSHSLRDHLRARIVEHRGGAAAGVACQTLHSLALEIVEHSEEPPAFNEQLLYLAAERLARREEPLRLALDHLADGYPAVGRTVRDLLDAGLDPAHVEALEDALRAEGAEEASGEEVQRACSLVRVAGGVRQWMEAAGVARPSSVLERAAELVREDPDRALASGGLLVYGFEDATGVATDLLVTLLGVYGGEVFIDHPADPAAPDQPDPGIVFTRRFVERLEGAARRDTAPGPALTPTIRMFRAIGAEAEAREVARRLRRLLDGGARPEALAVVARRLEPYRAALRIQLTRLGVPFSALDAPGPLGPDGRRLAALLHLLDRGAEARVERWLDALGRPFRGVAGYDLRLALFRLGAARLGEARGLRLDGLLQSDRLPLPVRQGFVADAGDPEVEAYLLRRRVPGSALRAAIAAAKRLCARLEAWSGARRLEIHVSELERLVRGDLRAEPGSTLAGEVAAALTDATRGLAGELTLSFAEFVDLLRPALEARGATDLGGLGSGVQVLDVVEARSRTFEHLFVVGLNRGVFPRSVREDPLLPDALRAVLARRGFGPLQDLPLKLGGFDEERYLFAQLLGAAPEITLSWLAVDDDNLELACSPLVERLRWGRPGGDHPEWREPPTARHLFSARADAGAEDDPRPAYESAVLAGLLGERPHFQGILALALEEAAEGPATGTTARAAARVRVLDEMDPPRGQQRGERVHAALGPYHGFVGPAGRRPGGGGRLFITTLENLAACPWQLFLERVLRLAPGPDPLEALPGVEPLIVGGLVHRLLERLVEERLGRPPETLAEALDGSPTAVPWPDENELDRLLDEESRSLVRREGIGLPGFARALAAVARPYLAVARRIDWRDPGNDPRIYAAEVVGSLEVADAGGAARPVYFKVDRADRGRDGLELTDYKTGRAFTGEGSARSRRGTLLQAVRAGERLQAVAYALAGGGPDDRGRYLFLRPEVRGDEEGRQVVVRAGDEELIEAFRRAAAVALGAWDRGAFFPRLVEPAKDQEPARCSFCRVAEACLRGDSGTRLRLGAWARAREEAPADAAESAWLALWRLPAGGRRRR